MKVGDQVRWRSDIWVPEGSEEEFSVGLVFNIHKDPAWVELQVEVLWSSGFWTQGINNLEVINERR